MSVDLRSLKSILEGYCARGWYLFPLKKESKLPAISNNLEEASNEIGVLMEWAARFPGCNWGVSLAKSGLVAVDVDDDPIKRGLEKWQELIAEHEEPDTLKAQSGSGTGLHYVFKAEPGARYRGKITRGIDVKHNGFIAIYPSIHPRTKKQYRFLNNIDPDTVPEWIAELTVKPKVERKERTGPKAGTEFYARIIAQLKEKEFGYHEWLRMGMALHAAFDGSDEGLELYLDLTEGVNYCEGDDEKARAKWESFKPDPGGVSAGTFVFIARDLGCEIPNPDFETDRAAFAADDDPMGESAPAPVDEWGMTASGHRFTEDADFLVRYINGLGFAMLNSVQDGKVIKHWLDQNGVQQFKMMNGEDFRNSIKEFSLRTFTGRNPPKPKFTPAAEIWLKSSRKARFRNVVFEPYPDFQDLNLWSDIPCKRADGDVSLLLELVDVLTGHDADKASYLLDWLAHLMQKPEEKCITVPVLIGLQGTGKGLFTDGVLLKILTSSFYNRLDKPGILKERFNAEQARKFLTVLDESSWRGDHELVGVMKSLTGSATMVVEEKFGGRYTIANYSRYMVLSNDAEAVRVEVSNRRYLICNASKSWMGTDKFKELARQLREDNVAEAFYGFLLDRDIGKFDPFTFPVSIDNAGEETKIKSLGALGGFISDMLFEEPRGFFRSDDKKNPVIVKSELYEEYLRYCKSSSRHEKNFSQKGFSIELTKMVPALEDVSGRNYLGGTQRRVWEVSPYNFAKSFCERNRLTMPEDFDDLEFLMTDELPAARDFA